MAEAKTAPTAVSVDAFLDAVEDPERREDGRTLRALMEQISGAPAVMWGPSIIGFGSYRYHYDSGHSGETCRIGFSPRKPELVLYVGGFPEYDAMLARLGKHRRSKACLYIKRLSDVDMEVLEAVIVHSLAAIDLRYPR